MIYSRRLLILICLLPFLAPFRAYGTGILWGLNTGLDFGTWATENAVTQNNTLFNVSSAGYGVGLTYGTQLAMTSRNFLLGLDYSISKISWNYLQDDESSFDDNWRDVKATRTNLFLVTGYKSLKGDFTFYGGYGLVNKLALESNTNPDEVPITYEGKAIKLGVAKNIGPVFRIGLEYVIPSYSKVTRNGSTLPLPADYGNAIYGKLDHNYILLTIGISFLFNQHPPYYPFSFSRDYENNSPPTGGQSPF